MYQKPQTETVKVTVSNQVLYLSKGNTDPMKPSQGDEPEEMLP